MSLETGKESFVPRARLMVLLGEQLITDEVAGLSELIKNSHDAEATKVIVELNNVSEEEGHITITDNGHGMTKDTLLSSWLELGAISKFRGKDDPPRYSESGTRKVLGEKGLGRLAVHKIGKQTRIITKRISEEYEAMLEFNWEEYEEKENFLKDVKNQWMKGSPEFFDGNHVEEWKNGTRIEIKKLQRKWTASMITKIKTFVATMQSPFSSLKDFEVELIVDDPLEEEAEIRSMDDILKNAHYEYSVDVKEDGIADISYSFQSPMYPEVNRKDKFPNEDLKQKPFAGEHDIACGPFKFFLYGWELDRFHKSETFVGKEYEEFVKPQTGIKVFRDKFRVFPYGNEDNDWLSMDKRRIDQFQFSISRSQVIGFAEISSENNRNLIDKSDREGLIDNEAFQEFKNIILAAVMFFQSERTKDRKNIKDIKLTDPRTNKFAQHIQKLTNLLEKEDLKEETRTKVKKMVNDTINVFDSTLKESEDPLLGAAAIGLTYLVPTHELRRSVKEATKTLKKIIKSEKFSAEGIQYALSQLTESDDIIKGLMQLSQKTDEGERLKLKLPVERAVTLMEKKLERNNVKCTIIDKKHLEGTAVRRSIVIMLMNMIDNSIYWLANNKKDDREIRIIIDEISGRNAIIVSDNGPGFKDDINIVTLAHYTTKIGGFGLGLYISNRTAKNNNLRLKLIENDDLPDLLPGGNIAILFPKIENE